uniref:Uncharacterized protein n=1 Tax=Loa loa TaxID=7209 RepID=A0A1I7VV24_LOALO
MESPKSKHSSTSKDGEVGNAQTETPCGELFNQTINVLYPFEANDEQNPDINDGGNTEYCTT